MIKQLYFLLFSIFALTSPLSAQLLSGISESTANEIISVVKQQEKCWNKMDFEGFMAGYWHSDSLQFVGKKGISYGWDKTLKNYQNGYPDKASSGTLTFTVLYLEQLNNDTAFMLGKWQIDREKENLEGHFSLLWKRIDNQWVITCDHTD